MLSLYPGAGYVMN